MTMIQIDFSPISRDAIYLRPSSSMLRRPFSATGDDSTTLNLHNWFSIPSLLLSLETSLGKEYTVVGRGKMNGLEASKKATSCSSKDGLQLPVGLIARFVKVGNYAARFDIGALVYLAAVLAYLAVEI